MSINAFVSYPDVYV